MTMARWMNEMLIQQKEMQFGMWVIWWYAYFSSCGLIRYAMGLQSQPVGMAEFETALAAMAAIFEQK